MTETKYQVIDLFAGPGGWSQACKELGLTEIGIEWDRAACETREAAGHATIQGDVRSFDPASFHPEARGLIASPSCQTFSMAGKGAGRKALDDVLAGVHALANGEEVPEYDDERTALVLDPLRWILGRLDAGNPFEWVALEQVPTVLPVWLAYADVLRARGYGVETAVMHSEQFGVPQTRKRAILVARYGQEAALPLPTHTKYRKGKPKQEEGLLPWVSMAEALGAVGHEYLRHNAGERDRPRRPDGSLLVREGDVDYYQRYSVAQPAPTITGMASAFAFDSAEPQEGGGWKLRSNYGTGGYPAKRGERTADEPGPTVTSKVGRNKWLPTAAVEGDTSWSDVRPSPTIVGSFSPDVVAAPGWRKAGDGPRQKQPGSIRVTVEEAGVLQSFPKDYPWQGSKTKQYEQCGNAIPPLLALATLEAVGGSQTDPASL